LSDNDIILAMLGLIDSCLVASLMVMVTLTGYENYVSWLEHEEASELAWLGKIDTGSLKVKIASSIVAISSIHLLQVFLNIDQYQSSEVMWTTLVHLAFVLSAFTLALVDRVSGTTKPAKAAEPGRGNKDVASDVPKALTAGTNRSRLARAGTLLARRPSSSQRCTDDI
jgi:uncharacterized protein (TIGR00645 family)